MLAEYPDLAAIFNEAIAHESSVERSRFLDEACGSDSKVRERIEALLRAHSKAGGFFGGQSPAPEATELPAISEKAGVAIGPYKLLQQIGEGGMGVVYMAEQTEPVRRKVALKVIKPGMDTRQVIARFEAERQALALMDHVNIARVFDGGTTETGRPYFVMELVHGVPITRYCDDQRLTLRQRLELFVPVCQAIQHAHTKGIIHRDLKPSNVMITLYDGKPVPKVIDFGVAKATEQKLTERTLFTQYGTMVGTLEYMSPEQAEMSALGVDTRSDIYSLGVLLYELLTGSTPLLKMRIRETAYAEILRIIKEEEPPKPSTRLSTSGAALVTISAQRQMEPAKLTKLVRGELDWIVMKCLEKDRNRRYETANSLAADVQRYLHDEPVEACPPSAWYRFTKFARRHKRGLSTASAVALAVLLTAAGSGAFIWRANQDLRQSLDREQRSAYFERIALAEREWGANNLSRMEVLLNDCPEKLRGWEWRYLKRLRYGAPPPQRHESGVYSVAFSPDGQYLATCNRDGFVRLCGAKRGEELQKWQAHEQNATCVQFSPDGRYLASGGWDGKVNLWNVKKILQGDVQAPFLQLQHTSRIRAWSVCFSPDGQRLAIAGGRSADAKGELKVWDLKRRQAIFTCSDFSESVRCVRFSPDGRRLATSSYEGMLQLWDAETGQPQLTIPWNGVRCGEIAFSPDGRHLASVAGHLAVHPDQEVKVWDTQSGKEILSLHGHVGGLRGVAYSPDGRRLASAGLDQTIKIWDTATGQAVLTLRGHTDNIFCLAFSPDGHQLASSSIDKTVRIWDASPVESEPGPEYLTLRGHSGAVTDVAFHPADGRTLASAGTDGTVRVWDFWSGKILSTLRESPSPFGLGVAYSPDGRRLTVVNGMRPDIKVWDIATAKETCAFADGGDPVLCAAFSPDGQHVASAGYEAVVKVWDATTAKKIQILERHDWPVFDVAFTRDGQQIVSCSGDSTVRVWDRTSGQALILEPRHAGRVVDVAFSRDGKLLASAGWDRTIKVWDSATWKLLHDLRDPTGAAAQCVAFGRDRRRLAWGSRDGTVKVWDGPGSEPQVFRGHTSWVQAVAFSPDPDAKWIASASLDGTVKIWKAPPEPQAQNQEVGKPASSSDHTRAQED
jgi:WD40 repeat protein/serine/threonine protein kinase